MTDSVELVINGVNKFNDPVVQVDDGNGGKRPRKVAQVQVSVDKTTANGTFTGFDNATGNTGATTQAPGAGTGNAMTLVFFEYDKLDVDVGDRFVLGLKAAAPKASKSGG